MDYETMGGNINRLIGEEMALPIVIPIVDERVVNHE